MLAEKCGDLQQLLGRAFPVEIVGEQGGAQRAAGFARQTARGQGEAGIFPRQVRVEIGIDQGLESLAVGGDFLRPVAEAPGLSFVVQQLGVGGVDDAIAALAQPVAVIRIVVSHRKALFIESTHFQKQCAARQQAGGGHRNTVTGHGDIGQIAVIATTGEFKGVIAQAIDTLHDAGVLHLAILITQQRPRRTDARQLGMADQTGQPLRGKDFGVVVEKQHIVGAGPARGFVH